MIAALRRHFFPLCACVLVMGCGVCDEEEEKIKNDIEAKVLDELDCSGVVRQETRTLVVDALAERDFDFDQLVASPNEVAEIVGAAAITTDTTALLMGNVAAMMQYGHFKTVTENGWQDLQCDDTKQFDCEDALTGRQQGSGSTSVLCDAGGAITAVSARFDDGCRVSGTENDGSATLHRDTDMLTFEDFTLGTVKKLEGDVRVETKSGALEQLAVLTNEPLVITSNVGKSCEEKLTLRKFVSTEAPAFRSLALDAEKTSEGKTWGVATLEDDMVWSKPLDCSCPNPGSAFDLKVPEPLGEGGTATLRLTYREPTASAACGSVDVSILEWPDDCGVSEVVDCGRSTAQKLVAPLISATCQGYSESDADSE